MRTITAKLDKETSRPVKTVGDLASSRKCLTFRPDEFVSVILLALQTGEGAAGVTDDEGNLVGLLTERRILRQIFLKAIDPTINPANLRKYMEDMTVAEVMINAPETLHEDIDLEDAANIMLQRGYRYMPVVSRVEKSHLLGIVSEREIAAQLKYRLEQVKKSEEDTRNLLSFMLHEPYGEGLRLSS